MATNSSLELVKNIKAKRIALSIQYQGTEYNGWQKQKVGKSIQGLLEEAIYSLEPFHGIKLVAAGRTDKGVHASGQVVHFDSVGQIPVNRWPSALNGRLPSSIRVRDASEQSLEWHACHSALFRRYRYTIYNGCAPNLFISPWTWHKYNY